MAGCSRAPKHASARCSTRCTRDVLASAGLALSVHVDARQLPAGTLLEANLCIIGAGAAGISLALEWIGQSSRKVLLLEGGGFDFEPRMQALYRGENAGLPYFP